MRIEHTTQPAGADNLSTFQPLTVRIPVAVRMTGIGRSKIYELIKAGDIETTKVGTSTLIKVSSLRRLLGTP